MAAFGLVFGGIQGLLIPGKNELAKLLEGHHITPSQFGIRANLAERGKHAFVGGAIGSIVCGVGAYLIGVPITSEKSR